ncbi:unnamed protein product [Heligmosomoides polygyrus]|uniref:Protein kinase domain-containing protein n=1 Tax=Heligmosomoides polygyrus TaxID=6339 RepID=A0A183FZU9_HELPZ|nr:unnamed protein product [Heligmosomoides polygyrus]
MVICCETLENRWESLLVFCVYVLQFSVEYCLVLGSLLYNLYLRLKASNTRLADLDGIDFEECCSNTILQNLMPRGSYGRV